MCGLIGMAGPGIQYWDLDILKDMCQVIPLRGTDGTGIVQGRVRPYGKGIDKLIVEKSQFDMNYFQKYHKFHSEGNRDVLTGVDNNFFAIHVRAATVGKISKDNAHPFDTGSYIGMHNGTLKEGRYISDECTDSELLFKDIEERGIKPVLQDLRKDSAYAIVILDKNTGKLHFARNEHRTLYFCYHKTRSVFYWASEGWMLRELLKRKREDIKEDTVWYFQPNAIYTIDPDYLGSKNAKSLDSEVIEKSEKSKTYVHVPQNPHQILQEYNRKKKKEKEKIRVKVTAQVIPFRKSNKVKIPYKFCCGCQKKLSLVEQYMSKRIGKTAFLCNECEDQDQNIQNFVH